MLLKPDNPITAVSPAACVECGAEERRLLHHLPHRLTFRRLCTTCVLRLHPESFCPTCFEVYPNHPPNDAAAVLSCSKCYSSTHTHCVSSPSPTTYICPLCVNPSAPVFKLKMAREANGEECRVMDRDAAKKLLAAAQITSLLMNKAVVASKAEAERRAQEAAFAQKRAKDALEHMAQLMVKEKLRKKDNSVNVVSSANTKGDVDIVENSNKVLALLNRVELRENEKRSERIATSVNNGWASMMDVDERGGIVERSNGGGVDHVVSSDMESDEQEDVNSEDTSGEEQQQQHANNR
ncbi:hypothetical protein ACJIZ3_000985 [Penstemon smallii]|uniref:RING-type domain-containing protein n=1 Tax=Penstemon smallii TaxID=265156 RepID=A0ABD3U3E5_9LAMI